MIKYKFQHIIFNRKSLIIGHFIIFLFGSFFASAQVVSAVDSTSVKIGQQITYHIQVKTDTTNLVVFPEGQTFSPLEMIESYKIDTLKNNDKYNLIKKYGLIHFDSGAYTIPKQKVIVGDQTFFTDSLKIIVNNILVDTTKQGLYDIKPIIKINKSNSNWWKYLLITVIITSLIGFLLYWFIWRKKPLSEEEEIALLPPYDRAKLALQKLDNAPYLENQNLKDYYSELTFIIRKYLDEKVYNRALESTTDELINQLNLLKDGNKVHLSKEDITNLENILKRADLVKFAKSAPDVELAKLDRNTVDIEIDHVKEALPEPTEEEKLLDLKYKEELEQKKKRKKIIISVGIILFLLIITFIGFGIKYGFNYVKDTIIGHESKELLEGQWVTSAYGIPPITIATPKVLKRQQVILQDSTKATPKPSKNDAFYYGSMLERFYILTRSVPADLKGLKSHFLKKNNTENLSESETKAMILESLSEEFMKVIEQQGAKNITVYKEEYTNSIDNSTGLKTYGRFIAKNKLTEREIEYQYQIYCFAENNAVQTIIYMYQKDDAYAESIINRSINSLQLKPIEK